VRSTRRAAEIHQAALPRAENGKVERLNRTLATEWAYRQVFTGNDQRAAALAPWIEHYNTRRRHSALGGLPPISRLAPT
jgi:transposase InsO family protein